MKISDLKEGDWVVYRPHPDAQAEDGVVQRVTERYAFVLYKGDLHPKATDAHFLEFGCPAAHER